MDFVAYLDMVIAGDCDAVTADLLRESALIGLDLP